MKSIRTRVINEAGRVPHPYRWELSTLLDSHASALHSLAPLLPGYSVVTPENVENFIINFATMRSTDVSQHMDCIVSLGADPFELFFLSDLAKGEPAN